jgi:hypothetical protein
MEDIMATVQTVTHRTVWRDRQAEYDCPANGMWIYFVTTAPAVWKGNAANQETFKALYDQEKLNRLLQTGLVPEHMDKAWVVQPGGQAWGHESEERPPEETPTYQDPKIQEVLSLVQSIAAKVGAPVAGGSPSTGLDAYMKSINDSLADISGKLTVLLLRD